MTKYVESALFVYTEKNKDLKTKFENSEIDTQVDSVLLNNLLNNPELIVEKTKHIVVAGELSDIKAILSLAVIYGFSVGLIPDKSQKDLIKSFGLPNGIDASIELALRSDPQAIDLVLCNDNILLFKAAIGNVPLLDNRNESNSIAFLAKSLRNSFKIKLSRFNYTTANGQKIKTAASGCVIIQRYKGSLAAKLIDYDSSV